MDYTAAEIQFAFEHGNNTTGYKCRTYSTDAMDVVHWQPPSKLISVKYDCWKKHFLVKFEKLHAAWGDYVNAIAKTVHSIMTALKAGGLDVSVPPSPDDIVIECQRGEHGFTIIRWHSK